MEPTPQVVIDRMMSKYDVGPGGCWISRYSTGSHGYSQIGWTPPEGRTMMRLGHRVAWESVYGLIPEGMTIDHQCRVRRCINPLHLHLMTNVDNARGGGGLHAQEPQPTGRKCGKGLHELLLYPSGAVACRECAAQRARKKYPRRAAAKRAARKLLGG